MPLGPEQWHFVPAMMCQSRVIISMPTPSSFTSQDLLLGGSALAAIQVEEAEFEAVIHHLNARFGLSVEPRPEALELLRDRLRVVAGRH
jgi:hypothetical protein